MNRFDPKRYKALARELAAAFGTQIGSKMSKADKKYLAKIDECIDEFVAIRRDMKKKDAEIRRLGKSTRGSLERIQSNLRRLRADRIRSNSKRHA